MDESGEVQAPRVDLGKKPAGNATAKGVEKDAVSESDGKGESDKTSLNGRSGTPMGWAWPSDADPGPATAEMTRAIPAVVDDEPLVGVTVGPDRDDDAGPADDGEVSGADLEANRISAWFGSRKVLERVTLAMNAGAVTALIGPSGCGKSTFLRILNRMHELSPGASLAGEVLLDGEDVYAPGRRITETRKRIGMVFQKPNPFPAMTIADNVLAGLRLTGVRADRSQRAELVQECLSRAGLWNEVKDRLGQPGSALSGGQQQRLCIARSLAVRPDVLLMDEPCSALDPTSTRRIEETIGELRRDVTIVIVTHNMQQAARVSQYCAFFLAEQGTPGQIVEAGPTAAVFGDPIDSRTHAYVNGRFG